MSDSQQFKTEELTMPPGKGVAAPVPEDATMAFPGGAKIQERMAGHESEGTQAFVVDKSPAPLEAGAGSSQGDTVGIASHSPLLSDSANIPKQIGNYEILEVLGRGGMGVVYKARQKGLNRMAALKMILAAGHASTEDRLRFQTEAEAVAKLQHPNIVQIFDISEADGHPYFSLEYIDGGTLSSRLSNNPLPARQAAEMIEPLARAMHYAHKNGILHRDLKPGNILLTIGGTPKITDFGLAKRMGDDSSNNTGTGSILGTPCYMAPEQAEGKIRELGPGVDVYALGSVLYHSLTGRPPFMGETVLDTLQQVKNDDPLPPSRLQPKVPRDLETICLKCLQKEPRKRYLTAEELADDLRRFLNNEPIHARPVGLIGRAVKWAKRRPQIAALLGTIFLLVGGGFLGMFTLWLRAEASRAAAQTAKKQAEESEETARKEEKAAQEARLVAQDRLEQSVRTLYAAQMNLAQDAIKEAKVNRLRELLKEQGAKLRGFEWGYLNGLAKGEKLELQGHTKLVRAVAFRPPDGKELASASGDGSVVLWNPEAASGSKYRLLKGHDGAVRRVVYSKDGKYLASAAEDGTIQVWDLQRDEPEPLLTLRGHRHGVNSVVFSPDADWLASGSDDGAIKIWKLREKGDPATIKAHHYPVTDIALTADGKRLASASLDRTAKVWDVATREEQFSCDHDHWVTAVAFANDGKQLATASWDKAVKIWDGKGGGYKFHLEGLPSPAKSLAFSPDGARLAAACFDQSVFVWDLENKKVLRSWEGEPGKVRTVAFSQDGQLLASVNFDLARQEGRAFKSPASLLGVSFGKDKNMVGGAGSDGTLHVWDVAEGVRIYEESGQSGALRSLAFSPNRDLWATGAEDGSIALRVLPAKEPHEVVRLKGHQRWVLALAFDAAGAYMASGSADGELRLWTLDTKLTDKAPSQVIKAHADAVHCVAFRDDGKLVATGSADRTALLWNASTGESIPMTLEHEGPVLAIAFQPGSKLLATASADRIIRIWDSDTGKLKHRLQGHTHAVSALAFTPDGRRLASGSEDTTLKIWDPSTGQETLTLRGHTQGITALAFSIDGSSLVSTSWDQTARIWEAFKD